MGVSFKVARAGTRFRPRHLQIDDKDTENEPANESQQTANEVDLVELRDKVADYSNALARFGSHSVSKDPKGFFSLNLFPNGFSVGRANEFFSDVPKQLHPFDRTSESLFCAIEYGCLPGDIFDDIPIKYVNGALLCEIRDYRTIFSNGGTASSMEKSPTIYKVALQMCMENVVKDISSLSDASWTYTDLLEVESRILKALRPVLHLNPKPMLDRFCEKLPTKRLDLGIVWSRKKRKLSDASSTDLVFRNATPGTQISCATKNSKSQLDIAFQNREVLCSKQIMPSSIPTSQAKNVQQETTLQSFPTLSESNDQLAGNCKGSVSRPVTQSDCVSGPKQCHSKYDNDLSKWSMLILGDRESGPQVNQGPIVKKPKQEPLDFSQQQLTGSQAESSLATEVQRKEKLLYERIEAEKIRNEKTYWNKYPSLSITSGPLKGTPKQQARKLACRVKEEPVETSSFPCLDAGKTKDNCNIMDMRNQSDLYQSEMLRSSPQLRANASPTPVQFNHVDQSVGKSITNDIFTQKRKALQSSQVSTCVRNTCMELCISDSLPRDASAPTKRKPNSRLKGLNVNKVESLANSSNMSTAKSIRPAVNLKRADSLARTSYRNGVDAICDPVRTPVSSSSQVGDPVLDRFSKIEMVTQRYGLNNGKCKSSHVSERRPFFCSMPLVAFHLSDSDIKTGATTRSTHSDLFLDVNLNVSRTRILTFIRSPLICQGNMINGSESQNKLIITEKPDEGIVEATVVYGHETNDTIEFPSLQIFPDSHHADMFAIQFTSLMMHEGYHLADDHTEPAPPTTKGSTAIQQSTVTSSATCATQTVALPPPTMMPRQSRCMLGPTTTSMLGLNPIQFPSQNNFSGGHSLSHKNIQSALQLPANYSSKTQVNFTSHFSPMHQQWQQIMNKRAFLQLQMRQREKLQQQLFQRKMMMGGLGVATGHQGAMQLGAGVQGHGNVGLSSPGSVMGMGAFLPVPVGVNLPGIGNVGEINTPAAVLARMRIAEIQGRTLVSGFPIQRNAGIMPTCPSDIPGVGYDIINQQEAQTQMQQLLCMATWQQQEVRSPLQPLDATSLADCMGSPVSQVYQNQKMSCYASQAQWAEARNVALCHGSPEMSSTPGSVGSCNTISSMELHGVINGGSSIPSGGVKQE